MAKQEVKVKVSADNKPLKKGLNDSGKSVDNFGSKVSSLGKKLGILAGAAAIGAVVKGLFNMAKEVSENADRLLDLSEITGLSTDRLQEYEHVARVAGVNSEAMANAVQGLTQRLARGAEMSAGLRMGLEALNIEVFDGAGNMRDLGMVSEEAIVQLAEMEDVTKRNVIGAQLFSGAWKDLAPILALGADGIEAAKKEAQELGLVMSRENLEAANDFRVEMETLNAQWTMMKREVGMGVIPVVTKLVGLFRDAYQGWKNILGLTSISDTLGTAQGAVDDFIQSIDHVIDREERRKRIAEESIGLRRQAVELIQKEDKGLQAIGWKMREQADIIDKNYETYVKLKDQEIAAAEAAAEAERAAQEEQERQRIEALGQIGRLQEQIAEADAAFIAANSDSERVRWLKRKTDLESELNMLKERAQLLMGVQGRVSTPMTPMTSMGTPSLISDEAHQETLKKIGEQNIAMQELGEQAQKTGEEYGTIGQEFIYANDIMIAGIDMLMGKHKDATRQILAELMMQITVGLIRNAVLGILTGGASTVGGGFVPNFSVLTGGSGITRRDFSFQGFGMAEGGVVPSGFPNDTYPAMLTSGETVIPAPHPLNESMSGGGKYELILKGRTLYALLQKEQNIKNQIGS